MKKRLVIFIGTLMAGGAERVVSVISKGLSEYANVEILTYYDAEIWYKIPETVKITAVEHECKGKSIISRMIWIRKYVKNNADVILSFLAPFNMVMIASTIFLKKPLIVADRNDPRRDPANKIIRKARDILYGFADRVVLQNENNKNYFKEYIRQKSDVIYNPVDVGEYEGKSLTCEKRKEIVCVGRIVAVKNNKMLLDAFKMISDEFPEYKLTFYGQGELKESLEAYSDSIGIGEKVTFAGPVTNVYERIYDAEIFAMTSDYEGMSNALLEAMCIGLPVVTTKVSGATDVIKSGENGLLVDCGDTAGMAEALRKMLSDDDFRNKCADNASKLSDDLKKEKITAQWIECIDAVCNKNK